MRNTLILLALVGLLTAGVGCRMCADPYDYCGPTYAGPCGPVGCDPLARSGSVLSPPLYGGSGQETVIGAESLEMGTPLEPIPSTGEEIVQPAPRVSDARAKKLPAPPAARASGVQYR
ncbi:MAG TPA: hypothetical protein DD670_06130 [Planctomycetaceae bacterium]|nr:hypothetical protein [Planctomycetaceae bacterium]